MPRVLITGLGCVTALGLGVDRFWSGLVSGESGVRPLVWPAGADVPKVAVGAQVLSYDPGDQFPANQIPLLDRFSQFAVLAARQAVADAGLGPETIRSAAVVLGTGCGGKETEEQTYIRLYREGRERVHPLTIPRGMPSAAASQVSIDLGTRGPAFSVTSACASAAHAVAQAVLLIRGGCAKVALAGGTDAPFTYGLLKAWEALRVLSPDQCRPFSHHRNGLVLGEGAGLVVLESEAHALARDAKIYAELAGFGLSSDAGHITDPSTEGAAVAMRTALADAGLAPAGIDYINAHGTGTLANDRCETWAIRQVFGCDADRLVVSSTKAAHGHALGASGALELIATTLAIRHSVVPPTLNFTKPGEGCDLNYVPNRAEARRVGAALSNSFAFGGLNAVLALRRLP
jgi:nodulation protein E